MSVMLRQSFSRERATQKYLAAGKTIRAEFVKAQEGEEVDDEEEDEEKKDGDEGEEGEEGEEG